MKTEMTLKFGARSLLKIAACVSAAGMLLSANCGPKELDALIVGIEAATAELNRLDHDDDINFGDWLLSELRH